MANNRTELKDNLAYALIYGGGAAVKVGIVTAGVAAGLINRHAANQIMRATRTVSSQALDRMWREYQRTGDIMKSISEEL